MEDERVGSPPVENEEDVNPPVESVRDGSPPEGIPEAPLLGRVVKPLGSAGKPGSGGKPPAGTPGTVAPIE